MRILAIESSCDESAAAVYETGRGLLAHEVFSQIDLHQVFGGVVPELASRDHVQRLLPIVERVLARAGSDDSASKIDGIAYTAGPGLLGALLVGGSFTAVGADTTTKYIARISTLGSVLGSLPSGTLALNGQVKSISLQTDRKILLAGEFTSVNGLTRNYLARINWDGTTDTEINFGTGANARALSVAGQVVRNTLTDASVNVVSDTITITLTAN